MFRASKRFRKIARKLSHSELQRPDQSFDISDDDLFNLNIGRRGHDLFLGFYSRKGLELVFEKYGINEALRKKGYRHPKLKVDLSDPYKHRLVITDNSFGKTYTLVEFVARREWVKINMPFKTPLNGKTLETLAIEWLMLQDPRGTFSKKRPQLPNQKYPGLGVASMVLELMVIAVWRLGMRGIVNVPDHFHNAFFYSRIFYYKNPYDQAKLMALIRDTQTCTIADVSWAVEEKKILVAPQNQSYHTFEWFTGRQILPLCREWDDLFHSRAYRQIVNDEKKKWTFKIDEEWLKRRTVNEA